MAEPIRCDPHGGQHLADWMLMRLEDGETQGLCNAAMLEFGEAALAAAAQVEADQAAAEAEARLAAAGDGKTGTAPAHTVKRGTSSSRQAHEARKKARADALAGVTAALEPAVAASSSSGPDDDEDDDADELGTGG